MYVHEHGAWGFAADDTQRSTKIQTALHSIALLYSCVEPSTVQCGDEKIQN
ncbi:hypothetical protein WN55_02370 [Dufourea novaeangliae]|uniref:Uncharacterized protein n=1 Tax=Dufourea novaeangliae TaxID=178035 RepID=A0A154PHF0_DUFNO|nr:hypothetical protein WN55_02370 [Dufourea novaeangliae]